MKIYHYCSISTLISIIKHNKIRFSDLRNSNDYLEDKLVFDMFKAYLETNRLDDFQKMVNDLNYKELVRAINQTSIYGICFSSDGDGILQWMTYGKENSVCLELDQDEVDKHFSKIQIFSGQEPPKIRKVEYVSRESNAYYKRFCSMLKREDHIICKCYNELADLSIYTKLDSWKLEHEHRIAFRNFVDKDDNGELPKVKFGDMECNFDFVIKKGIPVFHYEIPFDVKLIKKIIIGPNTPITSEELRRKLSLINNEICYDELDVEITKLTYRN